MATRGQAGGPAGRPADLVDYLLVLRDEPCARTVPDSLLKSISRMERVAEFKAELRATSGRGLGSEG